MRQHARASFSRFVFLGFFSLLLLTLCPITAGSAQSPLKVGFIGGLSGPAKSYGEACKNGLMMGLEEEKAASISVIFEDDHFLATKSVAAFNKLVNSDKVDLIISVGSGPGNALAPLAERRRIPFISWGSDPKIALNKSFSFRSWVKGQLEGARIADEASRVGINSVALVSVASDYGQSVIKGFTERFPASSILLNEEFPPDTQDFKTFLTKARAKKVTGIGVCLNPGQVGVLGKQAKELGLSIPLFGCETFNSMDEYRVSNGGLLHSWFVTGAIQPNFVERYTAKFGNADVVSGAAIHYDIARSILAPLSKMSDRANILPHILNVKVSDGAMGTYGIIARDNDQFFDIQLVVKRFSEKGIEDS